MIYIFLSLTLIPINSKSISHSLNLLLTLLCVSRKAIQAPSSSVTTSTVMGSEVKESGNTGEELGFVTGGNCKQKMTSLCLAVQNACNFNMHEIFNGLQPLIKLL